MQFPVYNVSGEIVRNIDVSDEVFAAPYNEALVHQAMVRQQANARQGTASARTRSEVSGTSHKIFRQKHTGFARAGSRRSPLRRGGGVTFGPKPRDYRQSLPKKMRRMALRSMLSARAKDGRVKVLEKFSLDEPKTREIVRIMEAMQMPSSVLLVLDGPESNIVKSARNLDGVKTLPAELLNVVDILSKKELMITEPAVRKIERLWGKRLSQGGNGASVSGIMPSADN
ncbi:MAG: 50S ribosomal protein L4 [Dehalococcoidales bacterium]